MIRRANEKRAILDPHYILLQAETAQPAIHQKVCPIRKGWGMLYLTYPAHCNLTPRNRVKTKRVKKKP